MRKLLSGIVSGIVAPVANIFVKREQRKGAAAVAAGKIAQAQVDGTNDINFKRAEWETLAVGQLQDSWKDEYITLIITSPIVLILLGSVWYVFTDDDRLINAAVLSISKLAEVGVDMGALMLPVVLAAIGIRGLSKFVK